MSETRIRTHVYEMMENIYTLSLNKHINRIHLQTLINDLNLLLDDFNIEDRAEDINPVFSK